MNRQGVIASLGTTIFAEMTALARAHGAINLAQGAPDFGGPELVHDAAQIALSARSAANDQYAPMPGLPSLQAAVAAHQHTHYELTWDPASEVLVGCGATELLFATIAALTNAGDEIVLFEPFYDAYFAAAQLNGVVVKTVTLAPPGFAIDVEAVRAAVTPRTKLIVLNHPHNPTGRVFTNAELDALVALAHAHDLTIISDEVYEHLVYDSVFVSLASRPGARERTVTISSASKTYSVTGWRIGWLTAPARLVAPIRAVHQYVTFAAPTPLQFAVATALTTSDAYFPSLLDDYRARRERLGAALARVGFEVYWPAGAYFICAGLARFGARGSSDVEFCRYLTTEIGVAAIPPSAFFAPPKPPQPYVRFTFCKTLATLDAAIARLAKLEIT